MSNEMVLVTGATGKTGRRVVRILQERGVTYRAASRSSVIRFDWEDESTWDTALKGATALYLVPPYLDGPQSAETVAAFARRAAAAGVRKAVMISTPDADEYGLAAELSLAAAGLESIVLRLRWFFQNFSEDFLKDPVLSGQLRLPAGNGQEAFIDAEDIAEVAVTVLTGNGHADKVYELTGPRIMSFADAAADIAKATGIDLQYVAVSDETFVAEQQNQGVPEEWAYTLAGLYGHVRSGRFASLTDHVEHVLGRPPHDFANFAQYAAAQGTWLH